VVERGTARRWAGAALATLAAALAVVVAVRRPLPGPVRLEVGGFDRPFSQGSWPRAVRVELPEDQAGGEARSLYAREAPGEARFDLPLLARGTLEVSIRATTRVRSGLTVYAGGSPLGDVVLPPGRWDTAPGPWARYAVEGAVEGPVALGLTVEPRPLVRRAADELARPGLLVDFIELRATGGLRPSLSGALAAGLVPLAFAVFVAATGGGPGAATVAALAAAAVAHTAFRVAPLAAAAAAPRLVPVALFVGVLAAVGLRAQPYVAVSPRRRAALAALVACGTVAHGAVVFFPNHNPPDIDIHVRRTLDLGAVPLDYGALLRYGSQMPTASQDLGAATAALGEAALIPYSPLPYAVYYTLHVVRLDLYWAMTAVNAAVAMFVVPLLWLAARRTWDEPTAWLAAALYALDLAVWHHLGRSHAPAVFGGALGTAALLHLLFHADQMRRRLAVAVTAAVLGIAALGYSSLVVLFGLFGLVLLVLLALDARGMTAGDRKGMAAALVAGGLLAGVVFYFHYVPGLVRGAGALESSPDLFPGRTFLVFHNESRQSLRLWALGLWIPLFAGLVAAPFALRRARPAGRPVLIAWIAAWVLVMVLKEPWLFPRLLRWAKEDQFVSPACALFAAAAIAGIPRRGPRVVVAGAALALALWLQARDFAHHANSLRL
jgi:hypothetical protein